jgi:hypothetical protein
MLDTATPMPTSDSLRKVKWKLVEMPLPRLQRLGGTAVDFVYEIGWDEKLKQSEYRAPGFPQSVRLKPGVAEQLIRLAGIIRPLIQQLWLNKVARYNPGALRSPGLDEFLFGADRMPTIRVRAALMDLQDGRCFYSQAPLTGKVHIDHFLPWSRCGNDSIQNLVATTSAANGSKSAWLAAPAHLKDWTDRLARDGQDLHDVATALRWPSAPEGTLNAARSIYLNLPDGIPLWRFGEKPAKSSHDMLVSCSRFPNSRQAGLPQDRPRTADLHPGYPHNGEGDV